MKQYIQRHNGTFLESNTKEGDKDTTRTIPNSDSNRDKRRMDAEVAAGKAEIIPFQAPEQATVAAKAKIETAKAYLRSTDWYVSRLVETEKAIPAEVSTLRAQARIDANID